MRRIFTGSCLEKEVKIRKPVPMKPNKIIPSKKIYNRKEKRRETYDRDN